MQLCCAMKYYLNSLKCNGWEVYQTSPDCCVISSLLACCVISILNLTSVYSELYSVDLALTTHFFALLVFDTAGRVSQRC